MGHIRMIEEMTNLSVEFSQRSFALEFDDLDKTVFRRVSGWRFEGKMARLPGGIARFEGRLVERVFVRHRHVRPLDEIGRVEAALSLEAVWGVVIEHGELRPTRWTNLGIGSFHP